MATNRLRAALVLAGLLALTTGPAAAQTSAFLFTVTTRPPWATDEKWVVRYEAGYAERTSEPFGFEGVAQRVAVQGSLPKGFTVLGQVGLGLGGGASSSASTSQEIEVLKDLRSARRGVAIAVGLGLRHEWEGASVLTGRVSIGRTFATSSLFGNLRFERPLQPGRDGVDLVSTAGWMRRIGAAFNLGVEAVGEDLEGLWESEEAEGGAKLFAGPSMHVAPPRTSWSVSLAGGPILYATRSGRTSSAVRPLQATGNGYTVRMSFGYSF